MSVTVSVTVVVSSTVSYTVVVPSVTPVENSVVDSESVFVEEPVSVLELVSVVDPRVGERTSVGG